MNNDVATEISELIEHVAKSSDQDLVSKINTLNEILVLLKTKPQNSDLSNLKIVHKRENIGSLLLKFSEISKFGKQEWLELINSYGFHIELNPRDSARDVMGKLARYLRDNSDARLQVDSTQTKKPLPQIKSIKGKRKLAENLQDTLTRLLEE